MDHVQGFVPALLRDPNVALLRAEDAVFAAMMDGWRAQMLALAPSARTEHIPPPTLH